MPLVGLVCHLTTRDSLFIENEYEIYSFAKLAIIIFSSVNQLGRFMDKLVSYSHVYMQCTVAPPSLDNLNEL